MWSTSTPLEADEATTHNTDINEHILNTTTYTHTLQQTILSQPYDPNIPYGDDIEYTPKHTKAFRLYYQNIRGAKTNNSWGDWEKGYEKLSEWDVDAATLVETNTAWTYQNIRQAAIKAKKHFDQLHINTSGSNELTTSDFQPGGTASSIHNRWTVRVIEKLTDSSGLGRWSGYRLVGTGKHNIIILTAYRPTKSADMSTNTCYSQQWRALRAAIPTTDPEPQQQMITDLITQIQKWSNAHTEIILSLDANDTLETPKTEIHRLLQNTTLSSLQPPDTTPPTYARGPNCIDYILGTPKIKQALLAYGFMAFYAGAWHSDHRAIYIDLDADILFGGTTASIATMSSRNINSKNKSQTTKFLSTLTNQNKLHKIHTELNSLTTKEIWSKQDHTAFEEVDQKFTDALLQAEASCKINYNAPWSPDLHEAHIIQKYWRQEVSGWLTNKNVKPQQAKLLTQLRDPTSIWQTDPSRPPRFQLAKANTNLRTIRKQAHEHRQNFLTDEYNKHKHKGKLSKAKLFQKLRYAERRNRCYRTIKAYNKPRGSGGLSHILIPDGISTTRIQNRQEMEDRLHTRNKHHFAQAHPTPCANGPLADLLGPSGMNTTTTEILNGTWDPIYRADLAPSSHHILYELKQQRQTLPTTFTFDDMIRGFQKWRESTTTSPSGKHLGIYRTLTKTYIHRPRPPTLAATASQEQKQQADEYYQMQLSYHNTATLALKIQHKILTEAIKRTHTLERWRTIHNFFLE